MSKRRIFQIHLSTAVVLMLVAGVLMWLNTREWQPKHDYLLMKVNGWPFEYYVDYRFIAISSHSDDTTDPILGWNLRNAVYDALFALGLLMLVYQLCEWRIRRREARKANE